MDGYGFTPDGGWMPTIEPGVFDFDLLEPGFSTLPHIPEVHIDDRILGIDPMVQTFYEGPKKCDCCPNWIEKPPTQMPEAAKERYDHASVRVYKKKDHSSDAATVGGLVATKDNTVEIQSKIIVDLIRPILAEIGRLAPERDRIKFEAPFRDLYFAHPKITELAHKYHARSEERTHLEILTDVMNGLFSTMTADMTDLLRRKSISFKYLWTLFPKGMIVYYREEDVDRLCQVAEVEHRDPSNITIVEGNRPPKDKSDEMWVIKCCFFDFDGINFGTREKNFYIKAFEGVRRISALDAYPVGYHKDSNIEERLWERGRRVVEYQDTCHCEHDGIARIAYWADDDDDLPERYSYQVSGRVMVDAFGLKRFNNDHHNTTKELEFQSFDSEDSNKLPKDTNTSSDLAPPTLLRIDPDNRRPTVEEQKLNKTFLNGNRQHLLTMTPWLPGYSLMTNKWYWLQVDNLKPITWNTDALDYLVFPDQHKNLLLTFVQRHEQSSKENDDIIAGKGQGLVVLLSGASGTGKTLTVEAIADKTQTPLYRLQAENLGSTPKQIGFNLREAFELALYWKTIILLDEADSLLSKRSLENNTRNEIVSVVLRQLEYYQGVIFLTTNLLDNIDEAFRSRIRLHLCYKPLDAQCRQTIWRAFLERLNCSPPTDMERPLSQIAPGTRFLPRLQLTTADYNELAGWELNGREIKNAVKNVFCWCQYNGFEITLDRVESTVQVTAPFAKKRSPGESDNDETRVSRKRPRLAPGHT